MLSLHHKTLSQTMVLIKIKRKLINELLKKVTREPSTTTLHRQRNSLATYFISWRMDPAAGAPLLSKNIFKKKFKYILYNQLFTNTMCKCSGANRFTQPIIIQSTPVLLLRSKLKTNYPKLYQKVTKNRMGKMRDW